MWAIATESLRKQYRRVHAVDGVTLEVPTGAVYALMGPNGAGKTTLIKMLMNLVEPTSGRATMLGTDSRQLTGQALETIGYVSENQQLPEWMTVCQFLDYCRPLYPRWDRERELKLIDQMELPLHNRLKNLSRGQRMKAALTSVLSYRPQLIVLDEPLSGLDPLVRDELLEGLLAERGETTVLISSHDLAEIDSFATHVGYMDDGRLLISTSIDEMRQRFRRVELRGQVGTGTDMRWLEFGAIPGGARWTETAWDEALSSEVIRRLCGRDASFFTTPLSLREVFLTLARQSRKHLMEG